MSISKSKKKWFIPISIFVLIAVVSLMLLGCSNSNEVQSQENVQASENESNQQEGFSTRDIFIVGSDTSLEVSQLLVEEFLSLYPDQNLNIPITGGGSGTGIAGLIDGTADLANSSRPIKDEEVQAGKDNGLDIQEVVIAYDGISVVVNNENTIDSLTVEEISKIFTGEVSNWSELGGSDANIVITSRDSSSGTHVFFKEHVVQLEGTAKDNDYSEQSLFLASNSAIVEEVSTNTNAIGYIGLGYLDESVKAIKVINEESNEDIMPSVENVMNGSYPISRSLYVYIPQPINQLSDLAQAYIEFVLSEAGQEIVKEVGFVPIK